MNIDDILASIDAQTEEYKKQARNITNKNKSVINQQYDTANAIAEMQAREQQRLDQDQLTGLLDANAVNEAVARRNTLESLQNMGLVKSGLNETSQTAISVMRGNADASARKSVSDAVMSLSNQLAALKAENESKRYAELANQDIALAQSYQQAENNAANTKLKYYSDDTPATSNFSFSVMTDAERDKIKRDNNKWMADANQTQRKNGDLEYWMDDDGNVYYGTQFDSNGNVINKGTLTLAGAPSDSDRAKSMIKEAFLAGDSYGQGVALTWAADFMTVDEIVNEIRNTIGYAPTYRDLEVWLSNAVDSGLPMQATSEIESRIVEAINSNRKSILDQSHQQTRERVGNKGFEQRNLRK